jgi:hypothetical protein
VKHLVTCSLTRAVLLQDFFGERIVLKELEHRVKQTVATSDQETLRKVAPNTLKRVCVVFEEVVDIFSICRKLGLIDK